MPKRRTKPTSNIEQKICETALRLAGAHGWSALTLEQIAKGAKISPALARKNFVDKNKILPAIVEMIGRAAETKSDIDAAPHDRLFDGLMARFDALQKHRKGIAAILDDCRRDPSLAAHIAPGQWRAMEKLLAQSRLLPRDQLREPLAVAGLLGVYYWALCCWRRDETPDMARTMAALDRGLRRAARVAGLLFRNR